MRPDDALGAARGAMLIGASLPPVYAQAAPPVAADRCLEAHPRCRWNGRRRAADTAARLKRARAGRAFGPKEREAEGAAEARYGTLKDRLEEIARQAADFQAASC